MTLANRLTLLRLALVPPFMAFMIVDHIWTRVAALIIFIGASVTDLYDGRIARQTGTVTMMGKFLDPLVDKLLICAALVGFVELKEIHVPAWMVVLIISREFLITGLRGLAAARGVVMAAERAGKFKTTSQITAIITILIILVINEAVQHWPLAEPQAASLWRKFFVMGIQHVPYWMVLWVAALTIFSGVLYLRQHQDLLRREFQLRTENP